MVIFYGFHIGTSPLFTTMGESKGAKFLERYLFPSVEKKKQQNKTIEMQAVDGKNIGLNQLIGMTQKRNKHPKKTNMTPEFLCL